MALYPSAVKKLIPPGKNDPRITARVVILHVAASNADSLYDYFNGPSGGVESHFYVKDDGTVEQYRDTAYQADANMQANDFAISIESQGLAAGQWSPAALAAIEALLLWCNTTHGVPLVKCPTWDGSGVGYHSQYPTEWAGGPRACPGPDRIKQFNDVIVPWMADPTQGVFMALTDQQQLDMYNRVMGGVPAGDARGRKNPDGSPARVLDTLDGNYLVGLVKAATLDPQAIADAVVAKLPAGSVDAPTLAKAVVNELTNGQNALILGKA